MENSTGNDFSVPWPTTVMHNTKRIAQLKEESHVYKGKLEIIKLNEQIKNT